MINNLAAWINIEKATSVISATRDWRVRWPTPWSKAPDYHHLHHHHHHHQSVSKWFGQFFFQTILLYLNYFWVCLHFVLSFTSARITTCTISSCTASEWSTEEVLPWIWTVLTRLRWVLMNDGSVLVLFCINIMIIADVLHPVWMNPIAKYTINSVCISYGESWILQWRILLRVITFNLMKVITIQIIWNSNVNEKKKSHFNGSFF